MMFRVLEFHASSDSLNFGDARKCMNSIANPKELNALVIVVYDYMRIFVQRSGRTGED